LLKHKRSINTDNIDAVLQKQHTDAFPALTVPFFLNTGGRVDNTSIDESGLGCSSVSMTTSPATNQTNY